MTNADLTTTVNGKQYSVQLLETGGRAVVWVRVRRELENGEFVWAFLSHRQRKVEAIVLSRFAKEVNYHLEKFKQ